MLTDKRKVFHTGDSDVISLNQDWLKNLVHTKQLIPDDKGRYTLELVSYDDYAIIRPIKENDISVQQ